MRNAVIFGLGLLLLVVVAYALYVIFTPSTATIAQQGISILADKYSYKQGETARLYGTTNCGNQVKVYADNALVDVVEVVSDKYSYALSLNSPGERTVRVESGLCSNVLQLYVSAVECNAGDQRNCTYYKNGCDGIELCINGKWGDCTEPGIICEPGSKIGCTMPNACNFGFKTCNACGTGYGDCVASVVQK